MAGKHAEARDTHGQRTAPALVTATSACGCAQVPHSEGCKQAHDTGRCSGHTPSDCPAEELAACGCQSRGR
ncbi:MAG: hypothetical protein GX774_12925 [Armatimonadetes bacterium]|jgi:hypothetical protein|nr:hypothetical protein [Armatimonadota bacterium]